MRLLTLGSAWMTVGALNLILLVASAVHDPGVLQPALFVLVNVLHLGLVVSSPLLGTWYWRAGRRWLGVVFWGNLVALEVSAVVRVTWGIFPPLVLFGADVTWLNLYLICLARDHARLYRAEDGAARG